MKTTYHILLKKSFYEILQVDGSSCNFPMHIHKSMCVGRVDSGEKHLITNGKHIVLRKNDLFYIPPYTPHMCYVNDKSVVSYTILCIKDTREISEKMIIDEVTFSSIQLSNFSSLFKYAINNLNNSHSGYSNDRLNQLIQYIDNNYTEQLSVNLLAQIAGLNSYYLLHIFKEKFGLSLRQFIIQTRIKKTIEQYNPKSDLLNIALNCGFYDQSHYIRQFKKHVGITPKQYFDSVSEI